MRLNLLERGQDVLDDEGLEIAGLQAAHEMAIKSARDIMADEMRTGQPIDLDRVISVTDEKGVVLLSVIFRDAVELIAGGGASVWV